MSAASRRLATTGLEQSYKSLHTHGPAHRRRRPPAEFLDQAVVTAARAYCTLRTQRVRDPLEDCAVVVVEPANQSRVQRITDTGRIEDRSQFVEMLR